MKQLPVCFRQLLIFITIYSVLNYSKLLIKYQETHILVMLITDVDNFKVFE